MYSRGTLEARSQKSRCWQGHTPPGGSGGIPSCIFSSWRLQRSLGSGHITLISASAWSLPTSVSSPILYKDLSLDLRSTRDDLISRSFVASAKTLFCNKVTLTHRFCELGEAVSTQPTALPKPIFLVGPIMLGRKACRLSRQALCASHGHGQQQHWHHLARSEPAPAYIPRSLEGTWYFQSLAW